MYRLELASSLQGKACVKLPETEAYAQTSQMAMV